MKLIKSKKGLVLLATLAVAVAAAVGAYAYFTSSGHGSGSASVGTSANTITAVGTAATALTPDGATSSVTFTASNGSGFAQRISSIHLSGVVACSAPLQSDNTCAAPDVIPSGNDDTSCDTSAFTMADVPVGLPEGDLAANATDVPLTGDDGTLVMHDNGLDQNGCQGAHLALSFTTS